MKNLTESQILELASLSNDNKDYLKSLFPDLFQDYLDLTQIKTASPNSLTIPSGGLGKKILVKLNDSPYQPHTNKSLFVDPSFKAKVVQGLNGGDLIVFTKK